MKVIYELDDQTDAPDVFEYMFKAESTYSMLEKIREKIFHTLEYDRVIDSSVLDEITNMINEVLE